jgi:prophage regulatory protein
MLEVELGLMEEQVRMGEPGAGRAAALEEGETEVGAPGQGGAAARSEADPFGRFLRVRDVTTSVGLSRAMIYRLMHEGRDPFPSPVKIGAASLWVEREVVAWKARRVETRGSQ